MNNIIWTETAIQSYENIIDYLFEKWTEREIQHFQERVNELLINVNSNQYLCKVSSFIPYRKCVVTKQTSLVYAVENGKVLLITFLSNHSAHSY
jgi:plasmid stabilization system protein ParE